MRKAICTTRAHILGLVILLGGFSAQAQDVVIVTNKGVLISHITAAELKDIFTGARTRFADGSRAIPVVLKGGPVHEVFLRNHLGDNPSEFRARWRKAVFTGEGSMLKECESEAALLSYVTNTPGAIGYLSRAVDGDVVRVITVSP